MHKSNSEFLPKFLKIQLSHCGIWGTLPSIGIMKTYKPSGLVLKYVLISTRTRKKWYI